MTTGHHKVPPGCACGKGAAALRIGLETQAPSRAEEPAETQAVPEEEPQGLIPQPQDPSACVHPLHGEGRMVSF